jgi:succinoglycan biosynthesis transport protein ExoP
MPEELEDQPKKSINWNYYVGILRRRSWYFLIPFFLGWAVVWGASWMLPSIYRSSTLILVEQPTVPDKYVPPNVAGEFQDRLQSISQQILSRTRLLHIIETQNLFPELRGRKTSDDLVDMMRKNVEIELVKNPGSTELNAFNIHYSATNPVVAQQVTNELTNLFITENLDVRQQQSQNTTKFLESALEDARRDLTQQEERVRQFKEKYLGELPGQTQSNLQILSGLQAQLQGEQDSLSRARQQNTYLESLLSQYRTIQKTTKTGGGMTGGLPAIDQQLSKLRSQYADLSSRYTERHPDVRKLKQEIARTEKMKEQLTAELNSGSGQDSTSGPDTASPDMSDANTPAIMQLESQLKANQIEIANRQRAIDATERQIGAYQARLNQAPVREQEYIDITRGYEQSKANYDSLLKKKNDSELATSLELRQQGEHFRILDPPSLPQKPYSPNRLKLCAMGLGIGLVLGAGLALGSEFLDDRVYDEEQLKELLPVGILTEIPSITTPQEERHGKTSLRLLLATTAAIFVVIAVGSALTFFKG